MAQLYAYYSKRQEEITKMNYNYQSSENPSKNIICTEVSSNPPDEFQKTCNFNDNVYMGKVSKIMNYKALTSYLL